VEPGTPPNPRLTLASYIRPSAHTGSSCPTWVVYEPISKTQACNPKALVKVMPLIKGLIELVAAGEIHGQNLRQAIFQLLMEEPRVSLRVERLNVLLSTCED